jgi:peptidoglycan hydrolase-like protein with peptidoglycan-binding domain
MLQPLMLLLLTSWTVWVTAPGRVRAFSVEDFKIQAAQTGGLAVPHSSAQLAQAPLGESAGAPILQTGSSGAEVGALQRRLSSAGYYNGPVDSAYGEATAAAVRQFQQANGLPVTGNVDLATWDRLQAAQPETSPTSESSSPLITEAPATPSPAATSAPQADDSRTPLLWWLGSMIGVLAIAGVLFYVLRRSELASADPGVEVEADGTSEHLGTSNGLAQPMPSNGNQPGVPLKPARSNSRSPASLTSAKSKLARETGATSQSQPTPRPQANAAAVPSEGTIQNLDVSKTTRLSKVNIVDELIKDLDSPDPSKRRKAIWELGQRGHSQAVQPLVNLMIDSDSKQRSLILAALSEIGIRTLKPMNRALGISLQDQNPEVRKNAIRDLTRIYDQVGQISQLLRHAADDPDQEVRDTAHWALGQLERIRATAPSLPNNNTSRLQEAPPPSNNFPE